MTNKKISLGFVGLQDYAYEMACSCGLNSFMDVYIYDRDPSKCKLPKDNTLRVYKSNINELCDKSDVIFVSTKSDHTDAANYVSGEKSRNYCETEDKELIELIRSVILYCDSEQVEDKQRLIVYTNEVIPGVFDSCKFTAKDRTRLVYYPNGSKYIGVERDTDISKLSIIHRNIGMKAGLFFNTILPIREVEYLVHLENCLDNHIKSFSNEVLKLSNEKKLDSKILLENTNILNIINSKSILSNAYMAAMFPHLKIFDYPVESRLNLVRRLAIKVKDLSKQHNLNVLLIGTKNREGGREGSFFSALEKALWDLQLSVYHIDPDGQYKKIISPYIVVKATPEKVDIPISEGSFVIDPWGNTKENLHYKVVDL